MKAIRRTAPGTARLMDVPRPEAGADDVIVEVRYAAVNPFDAQVLRGEIGADPDGELTLGAEGAGMLDGRPVQLSGGGLGVARDGTFAPFVRAPRSSVRELDAESDLALAATVGVAGKTAWRAVHQLARVGAEDTVLVLGAAGGVGTFASQLASAVGARVLAHTGRSEKAARMTELGLEPVYAGNPDALAEVVANSGVTVVLDPLGGDYVSSLMAVLSPAARIVTYGVLAGRSTTVNLGLLYGKGFRVLGTSGGTTPPEDSAAALDGALAAVLEGTVVVDHERLPLEHGVAAFDRLRERSVAGKLLLEM